MSMRRRVAGYLYILVCSDGSYYVGSTTNLETRLSQHEAGEGGAYTATRLPVRLIYSCEFPSLFEDSKALSNEMDWIFQMFNAIGAEDIVKGPI